MERKSNRKPKPSLVMREILADDNAGGCKTSHGRQTEAVTVTGSINDQHKMLPSHPFARSVNYIPVDLKQKENANDLLHQTDAIGLRYDDILLEVKKRLWCNFCHFHCNLDEVTLFMEHMDSHTFSCYHQHCKFQTFSRVSLTLHYLNCHGVLFPEGDLSVCRLKLAYWGSAESCIDNIKDEISNLSYDGKMNKDGPNDDSVGEPTDKGNLGDVNMQTEGVHTQNDSFSSDSNVDLDELEEMGDGSARVESVTGAEGAGSVMVMTLKREDGSDGGVEGSEQRNVVKKEAFHNCLDCNMSFKFKYSLNAHMKYHYVRKRYTCETCNEQFSLKKNLSLHMVQAHPDICSLQKLRCLTCGKQFANSVELDIHIQSHMLEKNLPCSHCHKVYRHAELLSCHIVKSHPGAPFHICPICFALFATEKELRKHRFTHAVGEGRDFICPTCNVRFPTVNRLKAHSRTVHSERSFTCEVCGKTLGTKMGLSDHMRGSHTGVGVLTCEFCGKKFARKQGLENHTLSVHSAERPFKCSTCGKGYARQGTLKIHEKYHAEVRKFMCETCGKSFVTKKQLERHERTHTGVKDHVCIQCGQAFATKWTLTCHYKTHSKAGKKPFKCSFCNRKFADKESLRLHETYHVSMDSME